MHAAGAPAGPDPLRSAPSRAATPLPSSLRVALERSTVVLDDGSVLMGGTPLRLFRLSARAKDVVDRWQAGAEVGARKGSQLLARRLVSAGVLVAQPAPGVVRPADITVVVPVRDRPAQLDRLLRSVAGPACVVVDDASVDAAAVKDAAERHGAQFVGLASNIGPSGARNAGLAVVPTRLVAFVDSDCIASPGWLEGLVGHFDDPLVAAVAPRVVPLATPHPTWVSRYEAVRSSLDRGAAAAPVRPGSRVSYVPGAALVVRRDVIEGTTLFDPTLRGGEDVDLVWRLVEAGWDVRYEPSVRVEHDGPTTFGTLTSKRYFYGTTAAALATRHPGAMAPLEASAWSVAAWAATLARRPLSAGAITAASTAILARRLRGLVSRPDTVAAKIAAGGTARAALPALGGLARAWSPLFVLALLGRRTRRTAALALVLPALADWARNPGESDAITYTALHVADDIAYGAGVWAGCVRTRTLSPLVPRIAWRPRVWSVRGLHDSLGAAEDAG